MARNSKEEDDVLMTLLSDERPDSAVLSMEEEEDEDEEEVEKSKQGHVQKKTRKMDDDAGDKQGQRAHKPTRKTELHLAAEVGDAEKLRDLLKSNKKTVGLQDVFNQTPLHLAAKGLNHRCCEVLLDISTAEINLKDKTGDTPLILSISSGSTSFKTTELLVNKGAKVCTENRGKRTAIHIAAEKGNANTLKLLLENDNSCINKADTEKQTALHLAVKNGQRETCKLLLSFNANIEAKDVRGYTALHFAAKMGFLECMKILFHHKSDVNSRENTSNTPLHLLCASGKDKGECVEELLTQGADFDAQNKKGETPFHLAQYSSYEVRKALENFPINLSITDKKGRTALHCAAERSKTSVRIDFILAMDHVRKMNVEQFINALDGDGYTALHRAVIHGEVSTCRSLVKAGADGNIACNGKGTSLHIAAEKGFKEICDFMIAKGVKLNMKNSKNLTPLHLAAKNGHDKCCELLLKKGALNSETDGDGNTALHYAAEGSHSESIKTIMKVSSVLVNKFNDAGKTPLHLAVEKGSIECCEILVTDKTDLWASKSNEFPSPVKLAHNLGLHNILDFLLRHCDKSSKVSSSVDIDFKQLLETLILSSNREGVTSVLHSCYWEDSLQPYDIQEQTEKKENKNLRLLVKTYPILAEKVFDKCMPSDDTSSSIKQRAEDNKKKNLHSGGFSNTDNENDKEDKKKEKSLGPRFILFYLDDVCATVDTKGKESTEKQDCSRSNSYESLFDPDCGSLAREVKAILTNRKWRENHVLNWVIKTERQNLLTHPLVVEAWIKYKWNNYVRWIHYFFLFLAFALAVLLSVFSMEAWSWEGFNEKWNLNQTTVCATEKQMVGPEVFPFLHEGAFIANIISYAVFGILGLWCIHDIYKLIMLRWRYFCIETCNFLVCTTSSIIFLLNFTNCSRITYIREDWQWIAGYAAIFSAWILVYYLYSTHPTRPPLLDLSGISFAARKVFMPEIPIIILIIAVYAMIPKGSSALKHVLESIKNVYGNLPSFGALLIIILIGLILGKMLRSRNSKLDLRHRSERIHKAVEMILDYDLLYPCLRRSHYKAWLTVEEQKRLDSCLGFLNRRLSGRKSDENQIGEPVMVSSRKRIESSLDSIQSELETIKAQLSNM